MEYFTNYNNGIVHNVERISKKDFHQDRINTTLSATEACDIMDYSDCDMQSNIELMEVNDEHENFGVPETDLHCITCKSSYSTKTELKMHFESTMHIRNVECLKSKYLTTIPTTGQEAVMESPPTYLPIQSGTYSSNPFQYFNFHQLPFKVDSPGISHKIPPLKSLYFELNNNEELAQNASKESVTYIESSYPESLNNNNDHPGIKFPFAPTVPYPFLKNNNETERSDNPFSLNVNNNNNNIGLPFRPFSLETPKTAEIKHPISPLFSQTTKNYEFGIPVSPFSIENTNIKHPDKPFHTEIAKNNEFEHPVSRFPFETTITKKIEHPVISLLDDSKDNDETSKTIEIEHQESQFPLKTAMNHEIELPENRLPVETIKSIDTEHPVNPHLFETTNNFKFEYPDFPPHYIKNTTNHEVSRFQIEGTKNTEIENSASSYQDKSKSKHPVNPVFPVEAPTIEIKPPKYPVDVNPIDINDKKTKKPSSSSNPQLFKPYNTEVGKQSKPQFQYNMNALDIGQNLEGIHIRIEPRVLQNNSLEQKSSSNDQYTVSVESIKLQDKEKINSYSKIFENSNLSCPLCKRRLKTKRNWHRHLFKHAKKMSIPCPLCPKRFKNKEYLEKHEEIEHRERQNM